MNMVFVILAVAVAVVLIAFFIVQSKGQDGNGGGDPGGPWPFYAKKLLTQPEQALYFRLVQTLPGHLVFAQVSLSSILGVEKGNNYQAWLNRINRMSADFVVCGKDTGVVAVIELDDATHQRKNRQAADAKKDKALAAAGIRIVRWPTTPLPDAAIIKAAFPTP